MIRYLSILILSAVSVFSLHAQFDADKDKTIAEVELELQPLAWQILNGDSTDTKFQLNQLFYVRLANLLKRKDSYNYKFDSLKTISIQQPEDGSFRIFTWIIVDRPKDQYYMDMAYYHFGLVQRRYITKSGDTTYLVIPLVETEVMPKGVESMMTDNYNWIGALYYKPRFEENLLSYTSFSYEMKPIQQNPPTNTKKEKEYAWHITYVPGQFGQRKVVVSEKLPYFQRVPSKTKTNYYVLMGFNGWDNKSNYKILDVMYFDPDDSTHIYFGAPIFYYQDIPKSRVVFKYSELSNFSMNQGHIKKGGKRPAIIYDHIANPNGSNTMEQMFEQGADGSYDALLFQKDRFIWQKNVEVADEYNPQFKPGDLKKQRKLEDKKVEQIFTNP